MLYLIVVILFIPSYSSAKIISNANGSITFTTSNKWYLTSFGEDSTTSELMSIAYDKDTGIKITQSKFFTKYKNLSSISDTEKSILRDYMMSYYLDLFKSKGYVCINSNAEYSKNSITLLFDIQKYGRQGRIVVGSYVKDYIIYSVTAFCVDETLAETAKVLDTLKVNGIDFDDWIIQ